MSYLINTMVTGSKVIYLLDNQHSDKMFPFDNEMKCLLPVGNTTVLEWNLQCIKKYFHGEVVVIGEMDPRVLNICENLQVNFKHMEYNFLKQLQEISLSCEQLLILNDDVILSEDLSQMICNNLQTITNHMYVSEFDEMVNSSMSYGVELTNGVVKDIYGHARPHYVCAYAVGIYQWTKESLQGFAYVGKGYEKVNCGQMPPDKFILENALQKSLLTSSEVSAHYVVRQKDFSQLTFSWDIVACNEFVAGCMLKGNLSISDSSKVSEDVILPSNIHIGENTIIENGVIFEGDCWIGDNVIVKNGAIIGANCLINQGSSIKDYCKINSCTVIGSNNKIGYLAEISGVTFDGVSAVHSCEVYGVIGKRVDIAAGVQTAILRFDDALILQNINGKRYSNPYTSYICLGDYTRTGVNNVFSPGVRVGSQCAISPGIIVDKNVGHRTLLRLNQDYSLHSWGSERYGW